MNKIQFLLSFITIIPIFSCLMIFFIKNKNNLISKFTTILALIMMANLINLIYSYDGSLNSISLFQITQKLDIGLSVTNISLIIALIVTFIWLIITIYSNEYFVISEDNRFFAFKLFSIILICFIILIIFSKNLISLFLFYQLLIFTLYFFNTHFINQNDFGASNNFTFSLLASSFFLFLATAATYKFSGSTEFLNNGILNNLSFKKYFILLILFILSVGVVLIFPVQILFKKLYYLNSPILIMIFIISYALVNLLIILKVILNIFGFEFFIKFNSNFNLNYVLNFIFAINLIISGFLAFIQNNLKKILIFLFFNQLIFTLFLFLILNQTINQFIITIISFALSQSLIFLCLGNINLFLIKSRYKSLSGIFYKLKISSFLLFFGLLNLIGTVPAIGFIEKFSILENYLKNDFDLNLVVIFANLFFIGLSIIRILFILTEKSDESASYDLNIAKKIDRNLSLIIPPILVTKLMIIFLVTNKFINNYLNNFLP